MRNLLLSSVTLLLVPAVNIAASDFSSKAHTHTTPIELKPISSSSGIKLASVCFLGYGDCGDIGFEKGDENYQIDAGQQCLDAGYVNSCSSGYCLDSSCPYDGSYGKCQQETCPSGSSTSCNGDVVGQTACGNNCKKCCDDTCPSGYSKSTNAECYDTQTTECGTTCYKEKDCDLCPGYYECGGSWQYCEGSVCPEDSSKCSTYCESDHFPHKCDSDYGPCYGDFRNGYCSVECEKLETEEDPCDGVSCGSNAYCSDGSCYCNSGYEGNANSGCTPIVTDPCEDVSCGANAHCSNGSCYCDSGYEGNANSGCTAIVTDPCEDVSCGANAHCSNGSCYCDSGYEGNANSGCTEIDVCAGVSGLTCEFGCASTGSCGECTECKPDPCDSRPNQTCSYGCQETWSDCPDKCQTCYSDNCRNRTAVSVPSNATCSSYYSDCSSKCSAWSCNPGYTDNCGFMECAAGVSANGGCVPICRYWDFCPGYNAISCGASWLVEDTCSACGRTMMKCKES